MSLGLWRANFVCGERILHQNEKVWLADPGGMFDSEFIAGFEN